MRIAIQTQYYPPELGAPQARLSELAKRIQAKGHEVFVITAMPNYPQGKIYPGYGGHYMHEEIDGIRVIRTYVKPSKSVGVISRLLSYFSFVFSSLFIGALILPKVDYLITESPPLFLGISGFLLSRLKGARWIFNVSDLWPESAVRLGIIGEGRSLNLSLKLESFCYKRSWLTCGQSKEIVSDISKRFPGVNTYRLSNGVDSILFNPDKYSTEMRSKIFGTDGIIVVYAGLHGIAQGLDQIVEAAKQMKDTTDLDFFLFGDGPEKEDLINLVKEYQLTNIHFKDPVKREQVPYILACADIAVIPLKSLLPGAVPSKLYEAMSSELPIALVAEGEPAEIVKKYRCGFSASYGDVRGLADNISRIKNDSDLRKSCGENGRKAVIEHFNRDKIAKDFIRYLEDMN